MQQNSTKSTSLPQAGQEFRGAKSVAGELEDRQGAEPEDARLRQPIRWPQRPRSSCEHRGRGLRDSRSSISSLRRAQELSVKGPVRSENARKAAATRAAMAGLNLSSMEDADGRGQGALERRMDSIDFGQVV